MEDYGQRCAGGSCCGHRHHRRGNKGQEAALLLRPRCLGRRSGAGDGGRSRRRRAQQANYFTAEHALAKPSFSLTRPRSTGLFFTLGWSGERAQSKNAVERGEQSQFFFLSAATSLMAVLKASVDEAMCFFTESERRSAEAAAGRGRERAEQGAPAVAVLISSPARSLNARLQSRPAV